MGVIEIPPVESNALREGVGIYFYPKIVQPAKYIVCKQPKHKAFINGLTGLGENLM